MTQSQSVLIVDDNIFFLKGLSECLEEAHIKAYTAESWVAVSEVLAQVTPDLIILDLVIPSLDGTKICQILKKSKKTSQIPILLYSGQKAEDVHRLANEFGAQGVLEKNSEFQKIVKDIKAFFSYWNAAIN